MKKKPTEFVEWLNVVVRYKGKEIRITPKFWICTTEEMELLFNETRKPVKRVVFGIWCM